MTYFLAPRTALFPSPLWGGVRGGGRSLGQDWSVKLRPPSLALPHKGGGNTPERVRENAAELGAP